MKQTSNSPSTGQKENSVKTQVCFVHVLGNAKGSRIGIVQYLDTGYFSTKNDFGLNTKEDVDREVASLNRSIGVSDEVAEAMMAGSMFGWRTPAAKAALEFFGKPA